jgi:hypothetical protein
MHLQQQPLILGSARLQQTSLIKPALLEIPKTRFMRLLPFLAVNTTQRGMCSVCGYL